MPSGKQDDGRTKRDHEGAWRRTLLFSREDVHHSNVEALEALYRVRLALETSRAGAKPPMNVRQNTSCQPCSSHPTGHPRLPDTLSETL